MSGLQKLLSNGCLSLRLGAMSKGKSGENRDIYKQMFSIPGSREELFDEDHTFMSPFQYAIIRKNYDFLEESKQVLNVHDLNVVLHEINLCPKICRDEYVKNYISFIKNQN